MEFIIDAAVKEAYEAKGIKDEDVKAVVEGAGKDRIYNGSEFIAKREIGDMTVYARYKMEGDKATILSAYKHKMKILDIVLVGDDTEWKYCANGAVVKAGHTNLTYLGATRSGPSLVEPESGQSWFEEYLANGALATAEVLFQQKRA